MWNVSNKKKNSFLDAHALRKESMKIYSFILIISSWILYTIYSALLTSYIAALEISLPVSTFDEFKNNREYKISVIHGSVGESLIVRLFIYDYKFKNSLWIDF